MIFAVTLVVLGLMLWVAARIGLLVLTAGLALVPWILVIAGVLWAAASWRRLRAGPS